MNVEEVVYFLHNSEELSDMTKPHLIEALLKLKNYVPHTDLNRLDELDGLINMIEEHNHEKIREKSRIVWEIWPFMVGDGEIV